ncbi:MAG: hypothetical protein ABI670_19270 [Chloroflexota bacterium]
MSQKNDRQANAEEMGITNRGMEQEEPGQDYVMDTVEGLEIRGERDDLSTGDRLGMDDVQIGRNLDPDTSDSGLTPDEQSGGERHIDSQGRRGANSHHG